MTILLAVLLLLAPQALPAETVHVALSISTGSRASVPDAAALRAGLVRAWADAYGRFADISFDGPSGAPGTEPSSSVSVGMRDGRVLVATSLTHSGATRSLESTVPVGSPVSLVATMNADIAFLLFAARGFSTLALAEAPGLTASLRVDDLQALTGWNLDELEPLGIAAFGTSVTVCFPHAYLTLGPSFSITSDTVRDLDAQAGAKEKLQLSGVAVAAGESLFLLSERSQSIVGVRPRLGSRAAFPAGGLSALTARAVDGTHVASLSNALGDAGIAIYSAAAGSPTTLPIAASYVSAFARDGEGNFWAWDATERRIRILTPSGIEVGAIRPLFSAAIMQLPEQIEVFGDGSFLLGGSGEVWKFERTGIPDWRLTRIPGRPGERLPASFSLALNGADGSFTLLDAPSRRLLAFSPGTPAAGNASPLTRIGEGTDADRARARLDLLKEKSVLYAGFADSLARDLLFTRAETAYLRAGETIRELAAESPDDADAPLLLASVVARRQETRTILARASDLRVDGATLSWQGTACAGRLVLRMRVKNSGRLPVSGIRIHAALPAISPTPSMLPLDALAPGESRDLEIPMGLETPRSSPGVSAALVLVNYDAGSDSISSAMTLDAPYIQPARPSPAGALACSFTPGDPLIGGLTTLVDRADGSTDALATFAAVLDALAVARQSSPPATPAMADPSPRSVLRSLAPDETGWALIGAGVGASLGMRVGFLSWPGHVAALLDTGILLDNAFSAVPALSRYQEALSALSRDETLCVPVWGDTPPTGSSAGAWALVEALEQFRQADASAASVAWVDVPEPDAQNAPVPVPFFPPSLPARASVIGLRDAAIQIMENKQ